MTEFDAITWRFEQQFQCQPEVVCRAPGRVNLIGDHTDYNQGFVLPAAIDVGTTIAASLGEGNQVCVMAMDYTDEIDNFALDNITFSYDSMWRNYVRGTLACLKQHFEGIAGVNMVVTGNVPQGAGLSSSASFEIAILKAIAVLYQLDLNGVKAALIGQQAENDFVGCNCGIMDQLVSALGLAGHAMLLDCRSLSYQDVPIPKGLVLMVVNSNIQRGLVDSEYNSRRQQCEEVAKTLHVEALRDLSLEQLETAKDSLPEVHFRRARHVITENTRTLDAMHALQANDLTLLGQLMAQSHASLKEDYQVTTPELDGLVDMIDAVVDSNGGARMTGGGFGGSVVALMPEEKVADVIAAVEEGYSLRFGLVADIHQFKASAGAFRGSNTA